MRRGNRRGRSLGLRPVRTADDLAVEVQRFHLRSLRKFARAAAASNGDCGGEGSGGAQTYDNNDDEDNDSVESGNELHVGGEGGGSGSDEEEESMWEPLWEYLSLAEFEELLAALKTAHAAVASLSGGLADLGDSVADASTRSEKDGFLSLYFSAVVSCPSLRKASICVVIFHLRPAPLLSHVMWGHCVIQRDAAPEFRRSPQPHQGGLQGLGLGKHWLDYEGAGRARHPQLRCVWRPRGCP